MDLKDGLTGKLAPKRLRQPQKCFLNGIGNLMQ